MKSVPDFEKSILELIRKTSTDLPADVEAGIRKALPKEKKGTHAWWVLTSILENVAIARKKDAPLCQDTGNLTFLFRIPVGFDANALVAKTRAAISMATSRGYLRQNTFDSVTGASYETNIAHGAPVVEFRQRAGKNVEVRMLMKNNPLDFFAKR